VATLVSTISEVAWVTEAGGTFALLAAAAFAGGIQRSRRAYTAAVEERALEAERTREEEGLRRAEEERLRIAREVHDVVAHSLSVVIVQANAGLQMLEERPEQAREALQAIADSSRDALNELRATLRVLRDGEAAPPRQPARDLTRLEELVAPALEAGLSVEVDAGAGLERVPAIVSASAYRVVQEAVTNVLRHAGATRLRVHVGLVGDTLAIDVVDDGVGDGRVRAAGPGRAAEAADGAASPEGSGLRGMRERVAALGGRFSAEARPEGGFEVTASIPIKAGG
jgi:signal transduction histidine kinase